MRGQNLKLDKRRDYMRLIQPFVDGGVIKLIVGLHERERSFILRKIQEEIIASGVN